MINKIKVIINSLLYKFVKSIRITYFPLTKDARNLKRYKSKHFGKRCFIIGNGPSLVAKDLDKLKDEITFAFNRIYYIFDKTDWRPTYYCSEDNKIICRSKDEINKLDIKDKFFPVNFPWDYKVNFTNTNYYIFKFGNHSVEPFFSNDIVKQIYWGNTVAYTAMQIAVYMGIKEIYLLGVDHHFNKMITDKGKVVIDHSAKDYFSNSYNHDKEELDIPNIEISTRAFVAAKRYADKHNIKIYNATRGGKLEVFERIDFDKITFEKERK